MLHLSDNLKKIRGLLGITQQQFADKFKVTLAMQKSYEGGKAEPDLLYLTLISEFLGVVIKDLTSKNLSASFLKERVEKVTAIEIPANDQDFRELYYRQLEKNLKVEERLTSIEQSLTQMITKGDGIALTEQILEGQRELYRELVSSLSKSGSKKVLPDAKR